MVYHGHVHNGVVVVDSSVVLPEGIEVTVEIVAVEPAASTAAPAATLYDQLAPLVGAAKGLPPDLARNHDFYLHGQFEK